MTDKNIIERLMNAKKLLEHKMTQLQEEEKVIANAFNEYKQKYGSEMQNKQLVVSTIDSSVSSIDSEDLLNEIDRLNLSNQASTSDDFSQLPF